MWKIPTETKSEATKRGLAEARLKGRAPGGVFKVSDEQILSAWTLTRAEGSQLVGLYPTQFSRRRAALRGEMEARDKALGLTGDDVTLKQHKPAALIRQWREGRKG